jgi:hypothetical protein
MMRTVLSALVLMVAALALGACSSDDSDDAASTTTLATTTTAAEVTTTTAPAGDAGELPDTPLRAALDSTYPATGFDAASFGVEPGEVTAAWYAVGDRWAVHYDGLTRETASGKCPGNSIQTSGGFEYISNSPFGALACEGYEELANYAGTILPPGSLFACGESTIVYVTEIPLTAEGTLYGSLEQMRDDGVVQGMTSMVVADAAQAPEINVDATTCTVVS